MEMNLYNITYILGNIIGAYIVYRFFHIFYQEQIAKNKLFETICYILYFIVLTVTYFVSDVPIIMMFCNIICFVMFSFLYSKNILKNVFVAFGIFLILMTTETIIAFLTGYVYQSIYVKNNYTMIFGIVASKIFAYVMMLVISSFQNVKKSVKIRGSHWIFILIVPIGTLYLLLQVLRTQGDATWQAVAVIDVFLMNFGVFWLYDFLIKTVSGEYERVLLKKENQYFENQLLTMEKSIIVRKKLRHDLKNHFIVLSGMLDEGNNLAAKKYLQDFVKTGIRDSKEISTGNIVVDSILNYKILEAVQEDVSFDLDIQIPEDLELPSHEICVILGNAIDNALEAVRRTKEKRISVVMKYTKGRLCIQIKNAFEGKLDYTVSNVLRTKKEDWENHGFGLKNIEDAVAGLNGVLDIDTSNQIFTLTVLLYLNN